MVLISCCFSSREKNDLTLRARYTAISFISSSSLSKHWTFISHSSYVSPVIPCRHVFKPSQLTSYVRQTIISLRYDGRSIWKHKDKKNSETRIYFWTNNVLCNKVKSKKYREGSIVQYIKADIRISVYMDDMAAEREIKHIGKV